MALNVHHSAVSKWYYSLSQQLTGIQLTLILVDDSAVSVTVGALGAVR